MINIMNIKQRDAVADNTIKGERMKTANYLEVFCLNLANALTGKRTDKAKNEWPGTKSQSCCLQ